ncbi:MAG: CvpA family protein [Methylococcaceae bacterium]|nr:MAG: CvpA family protein [Methylococcaceae bacterium]
MAQTLIWIDYAILGLIGLSALIGLLRGFIREAFSLVLWFLAGWVGLTFSREFSVFLEPSITQPSMRIAASFGILFITTLLLGGLLGFLLSTLVAATGFGGTDRLIGLLFGVARGAVIVAILVLLAGVTPLPEDPWWKESQLIPPFQKLALWLRGQLPDGLAGYVTYR